MSTAVRSRHSSTKAWADCMDCTEMSIDSGNDDPAFARRWARKHVSWSGHRVFLNSESVRVYEPGEQS